MNTEAKTYNHNGTPIIFAIDRAQFSAVVGKQKLSAPSLLAIKKKIDAIKQNAFEEFDALEFDRVGGYYLAEDKPEIRPLRVTWITPNRGRYGERHQFVAEHKANSRHRMIGSVVQHGGVTPDTPEAREAIASYHKIAVANARETKRLEAETEAALNAIPSIRAVDLFSAGKKKS